MDTVETVAVGEVRGDLGLRIDPGQLLLLVSNQDGSSEHGELYTETYGGDGIARARAQSGEPCRGADVTSVDVGSSHEFLHHGRGGAGDIEGEGEGTGGHLCGDEVTLLIQDLVGGDILALPGSGILHNLTQGLRIGKVGQLSRGIVADGAEDYEVALSYKRNSCGIDFVNDSCHGMLWCYRFVKITIGIPPHIEAGDRISRSLIRCRGSYKAVGIIVKIEVLCRFLFNETVKLG